MNGYGNTAMDAVRSRGGRLWVVLPTYYRDLGGDEEAFFEWATHEGHLRVEQYHRRFDYHQNRLQVFEVDPNTAARWIPVEEH